MGVRHQREEVDLLVGGVGALAVGTQPVESRDAERRGEVAVAAAAGQRHVQKLLADLAVDRLRLAEQLGDAGSFLLGRPVRAKAVMAQLALRDSVSGRSSFTRSCITFGVMRPRSPRWGGGAGRRQLPMLLYAGS